MIKPLAYGAWLMAGTMLTAVPAWAQTAPEPAPATTATPAVDPQDAPDEEVDVSVSGGEGTDLVVTGRYIPDVVRSTPQIVSVLSSADIARTGDGDVASALERVTGLSVVGNGYVYVRGLGDRYSLALLNGSPLPSPEPLKRVIPLDLFPTGLIASVLVQKSYSASFPGEFGGGVVNLTTAALPTETFLSVGGSISGDTITTGNLGYTYFGSDTDILGYDDGARSITGAFGDAFRSGRLITEGADFTARDIQDIAASFTNSATSVVQRNKDIPANFSADFSGGTVFDVGGARVGLIAAGGYSNSWQTREATQQLTGGFASGVLNPDIDFTSVRTENRIVVNGLLGLGVEVGEHRLRWTNLYIHDTLKQARLARGVDRESIGDSIDVLRQDTAWFERQLINTQLVGELRFDTISVDLRGAYGNSSRKAPYERSFSYIFDPEIGDFVNNLRSTGQSARIAFSDLNEDVWSGGADVTWRAPTARRLSVTAGYAYVDTQRDALRREFRFIANEELSIAVAQQRPDFLLSDFNIYTYNIGITETSGQTGAAAYDAGLRVHAGYVQADVEFVDGLSATIGVRYEDGSQFVTPIDLFGIGAGGIAPTVIDNSYWLPAATVTWNFAPDMQLRFNASKTIARPQFRELAFQVYQDTDSDRQFFGNPFLTDSELFNTELRYEWYFGRDQRLSLAGFYKRIDDPIENFAFRSAGTLQTSFANAPQADLYGIEVEAIKYVPLMGLGEAFDDRRLVLIGNYTYSKSEITVDEDDTVVFATGSVQPAADFFRSGAPLSGQSEHLANVQIGIEQTSRLSQQTLILGYASDRVTNRGPAGTPQQPDIVERPGFRLDFVARQGITVMGTDIELKFEARNLTGQRYEEFQEADGSRIDINTYDVGRRFSLSAAVRF